MSDTPTAQAPMELGDDGLYVMRNQTDVLRVATHLLHSGAVPSTLCTPQQVAMAVQGLKSLGLNPYASIRQVGFINGAMTLWGDLPLALVRKTGELEDFEEFRFCLGKDGTYQRQCFAHNNCHLEPFGAVCRIKRHNQHQHEVVFTQAEAKQARLWGKEGPWRAYPARMMQMRARSQALKDVFSDCLAGVQVQEYDVEGVQAAMRPGRGVSRIAGESAASVVAEFSHLGVAADEIDEYLGRPVAMATADELELLRSLAVALRQQDITWEDALQARQLQRAPSPGRLATKPAPTQELPSPPPPKPPQEDPEAGLAAPKTQQPKSVDPALRRSQELVRQLRQAKRGPVPT